MVMVELWLTTQGGRKMCPLLSKQKQQNPLRGLPLHARAPQHTTGALLSVLCVILWLACCVWKANGSRRNVYFDAGIVRAVSESCPITQWGWHSEWWGVGFTVWLPPLVLIPRYCNKKEGVCTCKHNPLECTQVNTYKHSASLHVCMFGSTNIKILEWLFYLVCSMISAIYAFDIWTILRGLMKHSQHKETSFHWNAVLLLFAIPAMSTVMLDVCVRVCGFVCGVCVWGASAQSVTLRRHAVIALTPRTLTATTHHLSAQRDWQIILTLHRPAPRLASLLCPSCSTLQWESDDTQPLSHHMTLLIQSISF